MFYDSWSNVSCKLLYLNLQSSDWLELRVVELEPGLVYLGASLEEAVQLRDAHEQVLAKLRVSIKIICVEIIPLS